MSALVSACRHDSYVPLKAPAPLIFLLFSLLQLLLEVALQLIFVKPQGNCNDVYS